MADVPNCPRGREEEYLADMAGENGTKPDNPWSRKEAYLDAIDGRMDGIEEDIENLKNNPDVVDVVNTYADLQAYDKTKLTDNDIIRVLNDETHDGESTYYRYSTATQTFTYIGTTRQYTNFVGTDGTTAGKAGLVPAPATTDTGKYLKADGTWGTVQAGPTVVQTTGTSTTDVMSQNATTSLVYYDPSTREVIKMGNHASTNGRKAIGIGTYSVSSGDMSLAIGSANNGLNDNTKTKATAQQAVAIGPAAQSSVTEGVAIGAYARANVGSGSVALGTYSSTTQTGEVNIGTSLTIFGYNSTNYRLLTGLHDPQSAHDAVTKGYVDTHLGGLSFVALTQAQYDALATKDSNTLYIIKAA